MNPFSKRIHQIKNLDLDLPKGTRNPFLDLKSVFGFTERNTPLDIEQQTWISEIHNHWLKKVEAPRLPWTLKYVRVVVRY